MLWGAHVGTGAVWVWRSEMAEKAKAHHGEQVGELEAAYQAVVRRVGAANEQLAAEYDAATQQWSEDVVALERQVDSATDAFLRRWAQVVVRNTCAHMAANDAHELAVEEWKTYKVGAAVSTWCGVMGVVW